MRRDASTLRALLGGGYACPREELLDHRRKGLLNEHRYEEALAAFEQALQKQYEETLVVCRRALAGAPNSSVRWDEQGSVLPRLQRYDAALATYGRSLELDPGNAVTKGEVDAPLTREWG